MNDPGFSRHYKELEPAQKTPQLGLVVALRPDTPTENRITDSASEQEGVQMLSGAVTSDSKLAYESWNALFSSLAFAEKAAANECLKISEKFRQQNLKILADKYIDLSKEENHHHELALSVSKKIIPLTERASAVYNGEYFSETGTILERLMSVHLVFEPSALAFLGYISAHAYELIPDKNWADQIKKSFNAILLDEVDHVYSGEKLIQQFWNRSNQSERNVALRTMRKHRAFLKAGLISFFKNDPSKKELVAKMLSRFDFYYKKSLKGVLNADTTKIAS